MESIYPINNVAYHFIKKVNLDITIETIIYSNKTFNNSDELKKDIDDCKGIINFSEYSDMFITCCTLNSGYQQTTNLYGTDDVNRNIYRITLYGIMMCDEEKNAEEKKPDEDEKDDVMDKKKIPNTTSEQPKHDVTSDIKIIPKSKSTEEKKSDEIEQTDQSFKTTDKDEDEEKEQTNQSSASTNKPKIIPVYYNDKIVRYVLPGENVPDNTEPVFDKFNNIEKYILKSNTGSKPIPVIYKGNIVRYVFPTETAPILTTPKYNDMHDIYEYNMSINTSNNGDYHIGKNQIKRDPGLKIVKINGKVQFTMPDDREPMPITFNGNTVRYLLPGEVLSADVDPVFDRNNNIHIIRFIIPNDSIKDVSKKTSKENEYYDKKEYAYYLHSIIAYEAEQRSYDSLDCINSHNHNILKYVTLRLIKDMLRLKYMINEMKGTR